MAVDPGGLVQDLAVAHQDQLIRAMALVCGDVADAEDAVQDAFIALWQALSRGDAIASPRAWLATASLNRLRSGWRRRLVRTRYLEGVASQPSTPGTEPHPTGDVLAVREELAKLPLRQRQAAVLFYYLDLSLEEAAIVLKTTPGTVKNALFRARRSLADALASGEEEAHP